MNDEIGSIDGKRLIFPALAGIYGKLAGYGYAVVRVVMGAILIPSGYDKMFLGGVYRIAKGNVMKVGVEPAIVWAWAVAGLEFFGAILLILGLLTRPVAFALVIMLAAITFRVQWDAGFLWLNRGYEVALMMMLVCLAYAFGGGGRYSLDRLIGREF